MARRPRGLYKEGSSLVSPAEAAQQLGNLSRILRYYRPPRLRVAGWLRVAAAARRASTLQLGSEQQAPAAGVTTVMRRYDRHARTGALSLEVTGAAHPPKKALEFFYGHHHLPERLEKQNRGPSNRSSPVQLQCSDGHVHSRHD
jgi:hypothetical protein